MNRTEEKMQPDYSAWWQTPWIKWGGVALFVGWLFYGLSAYYVVQKPFSVPQVVALLEAPEVWLRLPFDAAALGRSLLDVGVALWLSLAALGSGLWLLDRLGVEPDSRLATAVYAGGLGFGALGLLALLLGLAGWLGTAVLTGVVIGLTLLTGRGTLRFLRQVHLSRPPALIAVYLAVVLALALVIALLPPTSWDALFYHLKGPQLYLETGRIVGGIDIPHLNFPSLFEMLFMLAMGLRGDVAAKLLHFVFIFPLAGLVFLLAREELRLKSKWTAVLFLFSMPMVLNLGAQAYNDLALAFYQGAALAALLRWLRTRSSGAPTGNQGWLLLSGVLSGLAMGLKYTSFVGPLALALIVAWEFRRDLERVLPPLLTLALPAALVAVPWYLKNWALTGNPFYPFVFGGRFWDEFRAAAYAGTDTGLGLNPIALLRLPHDLILGLQDASQDGQPGPLFLIFLPLVLLVGLTRWRRQGRRPLTYLLFFALAQYLFWMVGVIFSAGLWQSRLLLPAFVALCPVLAWIYDELAQLDHPQFSLRRFVRMVIGVALALNLVGQLLAWLPGAPLAYVLGSDSRDAVLTRYLGVHYQAMQGINELLPEDAVVVFLYEPRSYYCHSDCRPDSILDELAHLEYRYGDAAGIADAWRAAGVTHVLLFRTGYAFVVAADMDWIAPENHSLVAELAAEAWQPLATWGDDDDYTLYAVREEIGD